MNDITRKIDKLRCDRGWSVYKLAQEACLPAPTIRKWFQTDTYPSIPALKQICEAFGITFAVFFSDGDLVEMTPQFKNLFNNWCALTPKNRASVEDIIESLICSK